MLQKENFRLENIQRLQKNYKKDPALLERVVYAFGLLEALCLTGLPFVFKGGTCLIDVYKRQMCMYPFVQKYFNQGVMLGSLKG